MFAGAKRIFLAGVMAIIPIVAIIAVLRFLLRLTAPLVKWMPGLRGVEEPVFRHVVLGTAAGLLVIAIGIFLVGVFVRNIIGRRVFGLGEKIMKRIPLFGGIYRAAQQISQGFLGEGRTAFNRAVLLEYPRKGLYTMGLVSVDARGEIQRRTREDLVSVFIPTTPNPTSGYLIMVPRGDLIPLDMSVPDALKLVISGGTVTPESIHPGESEKKEEAR